MSRPRGRGRGFGGGRGRGGGDGSHSRTTNKLFIGNMPDTVRRSDLKELFEKYGEVLECDIVRDFAFVHYATIEEAKAAVAGLHETNFQGSNIRVELSRSHVRTKPGMGDKNECYRCGRTGHWSKDCPTAPPGRRSEGRDSRDVRPGYGRGDLDSYGRDPYSRGDLAVRDPYARDPYPRDPYVRDPYPRDSYMADRAPPPERYRVAAPARYDPYTRRLPPGRPAPRDPYVDPYARPPPDYYRKAPVERQVY